MKKFMFLFVLVLVASNAYADSKARISCLLNKSESLITDILYRDDNAPVVTLSEKMFLDREPTKLVTLTTPQIVRYGKVMMILQNYGRSGYAFLRFERNDDGSIDGWVDLNIFRTGSSEGAGRLTQVLCSADTF